MRSRKSDRSRRRLRTLLTIVATALVIAPATALATHSFTDVDNGDFYHAAVDWMKDNGVTAGCNPPDNTRYCPDDFVTRGQMAVFLERLDTKNVFLRPGEGSGGDGGDADTVDGKHANDFLGADDQATDSDLLDGKNSSAYLGSNDKAADSERLDGKNSAEFEQFGGTIPSGTTLTGNWFAAPSNGASAGSNGFFEMTFPTTASAPAEIDTDSSNMADGTRNGSDNDPRCSGSVENPTAPAGTVCWYVGFQKGVTDLLGAGTNGDRTRGASVRATGNGTSQDQYARGVWAYTAP